MLPNDVAAVVASPLLDEAGRTRFLQEQSIATKNDGEDESLQSFAVRRFGRQVFERLIQPLVSGIYTADPQRLSMQATMKRFVEMERKYGSLIAAARATRIDADMATTASVAEQSASGARYDLFRAPQRGMGQLIEWLLDALAQVSIRTGTQVERISTSESGWQLRLAGADAQESFQSLILATSAGASAKLLSQVDSELAAELAQIHAASCAIVVLGFDQSQLNSKFDGYGIVVPSYLQRKIIAASFASNKFADRAPKGKLLVRCFIGGALQGELVDLPENELIAIAAQELNQLVPILGGPELTRVYRWRNAMPQYHVGHLERIRRIDRRIRENSGLAVAGNSYGGVGIPVCLGSGFGAAKVIAEHLNAVA